LFLLLRQTGLRISELINLPWDPIVTSHDAPFLKVPLGKMNTERMIPLQKESIDLIKKIQSAYPIRLNRCDKRRLIGLKGPISSVRSHLDLHFKKLTAGLHDQNKPITFHRLRHTYATTLLSAGLSIVSIMKLLGHRRIEMSLRYTKVTPAHLRNEYLKAIASIESQTGLQTQIPSTRATYHPSEVVEQLRSFVYKAAKISAPQKKNLLRYLARLKKNLHEISFNGHFKFTQ
jgi:integrase